MWTSPCRNPFVQKVERVIEVPQVQTTEQPYPVPRVMTQECLDVPYANPIVQTELNTVEVPRAQYIDKTVDVPDVTQRRVSTIQTAQVDRMIDVSIEETKIPKIVSQDKIPQRTAEQVMDIPVPQVTEESIEMFNVLSQDRVQQRNVEHITETSAVSLAEEIAERTVEKTNVPVSHVIEKITEVARHIPHERVQNCTEEELVDMPIPQIRKETGEVIQLVPTRRKSDPVVDQIVDSPSFTDSRGEQVQAPEVQVAQKTVKDPQTQSIVKELRSRFEVGHTKVTEKATRARNRSDKNRWMKKQGFEAKQHPQNAQERADLTNQRQAPAIRIVQKTVEVPRVQYIDKVADNPVDVQRQGSTIQASQHDMDEVGHVPVPTQSGAPTIPDTEEPCLDETADDDRLEKESKKRKLPMPAETVSEGRTGESDFDRFDDLVLPPPCRKDHLHEHRLW